MMQVAGRGAAPEELRLPADGDRIISISIIARSRIIDMIVMFIIISIISISTSSSSSSSSSRTNSSSSSSSMY